MGQHPELDLAVVGRDQLVAGRRDEGGADPAALGGADRNVLQVRLGRGKPPRRRRGKRVAGVNAFRLRVNVAGSASV